MTPGVRHISTFLGPSDTGIRVDRSTRWGNPFVLGQDGNRDRVCDLYMAYAIWRLTVQPDWLEPLRGKNLYCHCAPQRCHAETLVNLANEERRP